MQKVKQTHTKEEQFILKTLEEDLLKLRDFELYKRKVSKKNGLPCFSNIALLRAYRNLVSKNEIEKNETLFKLLQKQESRALSGISHITVVTRRWDCGGACLYCPDEAGMPKSYLKGQPAIMRAIPNKFDPARQMRSRLKSLDITGHQTNKIELHILGGSFSTHPDQYKKDFVKACFDEANGEISDTLEEAMHKNEQAEHRLIGITVETRPDLIDEKEIKLLRELGITRIEIGVQSIYDDILHKNVRGHGQAKVIEATKIMREAGFKINYHIMPNLYGSDLKRDLQMFVDLFENKGFKPDLLKVYPCTVIRNTGLYDLHKQGKYTPYTNEELIELLVDMKKYIPEYVRIMRLGRDVPAPDIEAGYKLTNIRQIVHKRLAERGGTCKCIRCREVRDTPIDPKDIKLVRRDYDANDGKEIFLSFEDPTQDKILALLRLRFPSNEVFIEELKNSSIIRELHTYGKTLKFKDSVPDAAQHMGLGKKLIKAAEEITQKESNFKNIAIISGVGVRDYYRNQDYALKGTYMVKDLTGAKK